MWLIKRPRRATSERPENMRLEMISIFHIKSHALTEIFVRRGRYLNNFYVHLYTANIAWILVFIGYKDN